MKAYYFHGVTLGQKSQKAAIIKKLLREYYIDLHEVSFNQKNPNIYDIKQIVEDTKKHILKTTHNRERIILIGSSLGCYILNQLITEIDDVKIFKIIFLSPLFDFDDLSLVTKKKVEKRKINYKLRISNRIVKIIDTYDLSRKYTLEKKPLLILHGKNDEIVSFKHSINYKEKVEENVINSDTELVLVDSNHRLQQNFDKVLYNIDNFLFGYGKYRILTFPFKDKLTDLWKNEILDVLEASYGKRYFGDSYHLQKFEKWEVRFFLVFNKSRTLIACSYICPDGKHIALGVLPKYRKQGIAKNIFNFSFQITEEQYAEVQGAEMGRILQSIGFKNVNEISLVKEIIGEEKFKLISNFRVQNGVLSYKRKSSQSNQTFFFQLMTNWI